ncbi:putative enzyme related to lactoylglutathione lyase [Paenibacillus castaneae]|uniref:VOC family protein n=1 Tax=Paenibacillus castaneae TaxID=474957 RepID=UPI000C9CCC1B|nr:VOC family protein [Paenibacillus castaneae]NIK76665.1 putative enzyme related to lactoylglutathione lyase [Paenibacillus castaneae]
MNQLTVAKVALKRLGCLYMPVDDGVNIVWPWYENTLTRTGTGTRQQDIFMDEVEKKGLTNTFLTDEWIPGETYEMFSIRFETDCIEELYERIASSGVEVEPLIDVDNKGFMFCFKDPQGHKFQVWQNSKTVTQPMRQGVNAFIRVAALFFPSSNPEASYLWYTETLGGPVNEKGQPVTEAGEEIYFIQSLTPKTYNFETPATSSIRNMAFAMFEVNGLSKLHRQMIDQGLKVSYQIQDRGGCGRQFQLYDPDGNKWDIWERQTMVHWRDEGADSSNWKERYLFCDYFGERLMDEYLETLNGHHLRESVTVVQIMNYNKMLEIDPEGIQKLLESLDQFCEQNPDRAFQVLLREGWYDTEQTVVYRE